MRSLAVLVALLCSALLASTSVAAAADGPPVKVAPPGLSGQKLLGQTLTASAGTWDGTQPITYQYEFLRCDSLTVTGTPSCSTVQWYSPSNTYTLTKADVYKSIKVRVKATNSAGWNQSEYSPRHGDVLTRCGFYCQTISSTSGLRSYWRLDDAPAGSCQQNPLYDLKRNQLVGQLCTNSGEQQIAGATVDDDSLATSFFNSWGTFSFTGAPDVDVSGTNPFTVELWLKPEDQYSLGELLNFGDAVRVDSTNYWGSPGLQLTRAGSYVQSNLCMGYQQWGHLVITYDGASLKAYCNGTLRTQLASTAAVTKPAGDYYRYVAADASADELSVYDRALSASEVANHYAAKSRTAGPPKKVAPPVLSGRKLVGETLTASTGLWDGTEPMTYEYEFLRCDPMVVSGTPSCSTVQWYSSSNTYTLTKADAYKTIKVRVKATNALGWNQSEYSDRYGDILTSCGRYCTTVLGTAGLKSFWRLDDAPAGSCQQNPIYDLKRGRTVGQLCTNSDEQQIAGATSDDLSFAMSFFNPWGTFYFTGVPDVDVSGTNPFTVELWLQPQDQYSLGELLNFGDAVRVDSTNYWGSPGLQLTRAGSYVQSNLCMGYQQWGHLAITYDGATLKAFCNGSLRTQLASTAPVTKPAGDFYRYLAADAGGDEVAVYDRALAASEIAAHYGAR